MFPETVERKGGGTIFDNERWSDQASLKAKPGVPTCGMNEINEPDWKLLRELKPVALERLCARILQRVALQCASNGETSHQRFLKAFSLIESGNDDIARTFDDMRRSNALERLRAMIAQGLITDEELLRFSPELRSRPLRSRS